MKFAIADTHYFNAIGFDTTHWRKSLDGNKAICHEELALTLGSKNNMEIYEHNSKELQDILRGEEWNKNLQE